MTAVFFYIVFANRDLPITLPQIYLGEDRAAMQSVCMSSILGMQRVAVWLGNEIEATEVGPWASRNRPSSLPYGVVRPKVW
jgi:hypothetical protein